MSEFELQFGESVWPFRVPDGQLVTVAPRVAARPAIADLGVAVREAFEKPVGLDFPLRSALTPDDRVVLVIDEQLSRLGELLTEMLKYLAAAGIGPESVTILSCTSGDQHWIDELPDEFADVHTEIHQPAERKHLSYLATTKKGRRVYLNRTLLDADQIISISGRRYDPMLGYSGCEGSIYPALSDRESLQAAADELTTAVPTIEPSGVRAEAAEVAFLLSSTIYLQAIESAGDGIEQLCAGLHSSGAHGVRLLDDRWRFTLGSPVDVVLAAVGCHANRLDFAAVARAAACAARAVKSGGAIVILADGEPKLEEAMEMLRDADEPKAARRQLTQKKPDGLAAPFLWISAAEHARLFLASGLRPEVVEDLFATPIQSPKEVQRLFAQSERSLALPDAEKSLVVVE
jgi:nickel-dependent lactate racemase